MGWPQGPVHKYVKKRQKPRINKRLCLECGSEKHEIYGNMRGGLCYECRDKKRYTIRKCETCGTNFKIAKLRLLTPRGAGSPYTQEAGRFCSRKCYCLFHKAGIETPCLNCGEIFKKYKGYGNQKFCSRDCRGLHKSKVAQEKHEARAYQRSLPEKTDPVIKEFQKIWQLLCEGKRQEHREKSKRGLLKYLKEKRYHQKTCIVCNKSFLARTKDIKCCGEECRRAIKRGPRLKRKSCGWKNEAGYKLIYVPNHSWPTRKDKYRLEHRVVMELHLQRALQIWEHIHHKNGIKTDNRLENLEIVINQQHSSKHLHPSQCPYCNAVFKTRHPVQIDTKDDSAHTRLAYL